MLGIDDFAGKYIGMRINPETFYKFFEPNGSSSDYRYYFCEKEDFDYFAKEYIVDDPRFYDYGPDEDRDEDLIEDEIEDVDYTELPYPDLSIFIALSTNEIGQEIIDKVSICKTYQTGCFTPGAQSMILTNGEAEWIAKKMREVIL